jgi:hypothetical protein
MEVAIRRSQTASFIAGIAERLGVPVSAIKKPSKAERKELDTRINEQLTYLDKFARELRAGKVTPQMAQARAAMYAGPTRTTYYATLHPDLPFQPGEGTECMANCKCEWVQKDDGYYWTLSAVEHCPTCLDRASNNPYQTE